MAFYQQNVAIALQFSSHVDFDSRDVADDQYEDINKDRDTGEPGGPCPPPKKNLSVISEILLFCKLWLLLHLFIRAGPKTKSCISVFGSQRSSQKKLCNFHPSKNIRQFTHPILINVTTNFKWKKTRFYSRGSDPRSFVKKSYLTILTDLCIIKKNF